MKKYEHYKNSGVEWLGEIPEHWELSRLGVLLNPISINNRVDLSLLSITRERGVILRDLEDEGANHNFIPDDLSNYKVLLKGQFGINKMKAWQGSYGISDFDGIVSPAYFIFNLDKKMTPKYFHLAIRSKLYVSFFASASDGVRIGQWDLSKERMKQVPFLIPSLKEQTDIAEFLDDKIAKIDQAIVIKQQQIDLLKERRQILIHKAVTRGLDDTVKLKDSGVEWIGEIPEHWEVKKVKHFGTIKSGESVVNSLLSDSGIFEVFGGNGKMGFYNKFNVEGEKIIIGRVGAYCGNVRFINEKKWISDNALILTLNNKKLYNYISILLESGNLNNLNSSNAQPLITGTKVLNFLIPIPRILEQKQIEEFIKTAINKSAKAISLKEQEIEKLKEYKSSLIDGAVTGKVRLS